MSNKNNKIIFILSVLLIFSIVFNLYILQENRTQKKYNDHFLNSVFPYINKELGYILDDTYECFIKEDHIKLTSIDRRLTFVNFFLRDIYFLNHEFDFNVNALSSYFLYLLQDPNNITDYDREALRQLSNLGSVLKLPNNHIYEKNVWIIKEKNKLFPTEKTKKYYSEIEKISLDTIKKHELSSPE
jgi:hypothetical protein